MPASPPWRCTAAPAPAPSAGSAEYDTIAAIVAATDIPVFANGDIDSPQMAAAVIAHTGAAGVMIGRAAQGQPWLCGQIAAHLDTGVDTRRRHARREQFAILRRHVTHLHQFYGDFMGVRIARKHVGWYLECQTRRLRATQSSSIGLHIPQNSYTIILTSSSGFESNKELAA